MTESRRSERVTATAATIAAIAAVVAALCVGYQSIVTWAVIDGTLKGLKSDELGAVTVQVACSSFADFVLERADEGLTPQQIEAVWSVSTHKVDDKALLLTNQDTCGGVEAILQAAGKR